MTTPDLMIDADQIAVFCRRHRIRKLAIFGSALRGELRPESDIDVLVEFEPGVRVTLFDMGRAQVELSALLEREVDLKTDGFLSPHFRQQVIDSARVIYERG